MMRVAVRARARVGEGPVWDAAPGVLHWVDILAGQLHTSDLATGATRTRAVPTLLGAAAPRARGGFVAAVAEGFAEVGEDGMRVRQPVLAEGIRMNDAKCDPAGRFWAGSTALDFAPGRGALHVLEPDWSTRVVLDGLTQPNGLGWSPDGATFYLVDTAERELSAFNAGSLAGRRLVRRFGADEVPDGLCVDAAGCLWVALWGGSRVMRLSPEGEVLTTLPVPATQPTSCAFAGPGLDVLCVTSAREGLDRADDDSALDGAVFAFSNVGAAGVPIAKFAG
jgi:sugar lactone lactonase YvrE